MTKITLTAVYHNDKDRNGNPYMSKAGKPYTKCNVKATEYGDKYISGFGNKTTQGWKVGDVVEVEIEQRGEYLNFSLPKAQVGMSEVDRETLMRIERLAYNTNVHVMRIYKHLEIPDPVPMAGNTNVPYPEHAQAPSFDEVTPEDIPF